MGDYYTNVVPIDVEAEDARLVAGKVVEFLVGEKIMQPEITDCTLTNTGGHAPGPNYYKALAAPYPELLTLQTNGIEIVVARSAFDSGGLEEIQCPNCGHSVMDGEWGAALQEWLGRKPNNEILCTACSYNGAITSYIFEPPFVFAELGFTFWNWGNELDNTFIEELEKITDSRIAITFGKF
jgi:hypothetical protein